MSEQSEVNNDIRFLERTIQENETKNTSRCKINRSI